LKNYIEVLEDFSKKMPERNTRRPRKKGKIEVGEQVVVPATGETEN
jgi:hypothetical protein